MDSNAATAPVPQNLMHDVMPPAPVQPTMADVPVVQQAPQPANIVQPAPVAQAPTQYNPVAASSVPVAAPTAQAQLHTAQPAVHKPESNTPMLAIILATVVAAGLILATVYMYYQGNF